MKSEIKDYPKTTDEQCTRGEAWVGVFLVLALFFAWTGGSIAFGMWLGGAS